jgi:hypothetical protein
MRAVATQVYDRHRLFVHVPQMQRVGIGSIRSKGRTMAGTGLDYKNYTKAHENCTPRGI